MNLHELQTFVSIAQLGGVTRAAGQLHRSQPAITRRVKAEMYCEDMKFEYKSSAWV